jgi:hypothetical protein
MFRPELFFNTWLVSSWVLHELMKEEEKGILLSQTLFADDVFLPLWSIEVDG